MFEDSISKLHNLQRKLEQLDGEHSVELSELFPDEFMLRNTEFPSLDSMFEESGFTIKSSEDLAAIPDEEWEGFIQVRTRFTSWDEMKNAAAEEWAMRRLELE